MNATMEPTPTAKELTGRRICLERFTYAILYSVAAQYILLVIFLLFVNFNLLHPVSWVLGAFRLLFSVSTWLWITPLIAAVIVHGVFLAKSYLVETQYCPTRFQQFLRTFAHRSVLLVVNFFIGILSAWLYTRFLRDEYRLLMLTEGDKPAINERYLFLLLSGAFAGIYYYVKNKSEAAVINFPIIQQQLYRQIRSSLYSIVFNSLFNSFMPMVVYACCYYLLVALLRYKTVAFSSRTLPLEESHFANFWNLITDLRLLAYTWILLSQILSNVTLMHVLFRIFLTESRTFPIELNVYQNATTASSEVTLVQALANGNIPITQQLAAYDLFSVANDANPARRAQLFALSNPGGHAFNWRVLSGECLKLIREYAADLAKSIEGMESKPRPVIAARLRSTASMDAEKLLLRQYNENFGIRSLSTNDLYGALGGKSTEQPTMLRGITANAMEKPIASAVTALRNIRLVQYLFLESKMARTCYLLSSQSQCIAWITLSMSILATQSLEEDTFGVVQDDLPAIIHTLLQLKHVVDKVGSINLDVKKIDRNYIALRSAVKRSLYRVANAIAPYLHDLLLEPADLKALQLFINFREA